MTDLTHAVQFLQAAFTILLSLAFGEAFKQLVPDGDKDLRLDRVWSLVAFIFMIFPFFHGMTRYFYTTYLTHPKDALAPVAGYLMFDGIMFMTMAAMFFVMSRSLSPSHWKRFFYALAGLLTFDTVWIVVSITRGSELGRWLVMNAIMGAVLFIIYFCYRGARTQPPEDNRILFGPTSLCALVTIGMATIDYVWMKDFFFSK